MDCFSSLPWVKSNREFRLLTIMPQTAYLKEHSFSILSYGALLCELLLDSHSPHYKAVLNTPNAKKKKCRAYQTIDRTTTWVKLFFSKTYLGNSAIETSKALSKHAPRTNFPETLGLRQTQKSTIGWIQFWTTGPQELQSQRIGCYGHACHMPH